MTSMSVNKMNDYWNYTCETFFDACRSGKLLKVESMLERERRSYKKFKRSNSSKPFISVLRAVNPITYMSALMVATKFADILGNLRSFPAISAFAEISRQFQHAKVAPSMEIITLREPVELARNDSFELTWLKG